MLYYQISHLDEAYQLLLKYCSIMLINPDPMTNQNNAIFDAFKMARPGFLKIAINKSDSVYKWVEKKMHENIAQHKNTKTIQSYTIFNVKTIVGSHPSYQIVTDYFFV